LEAENTAMEQQLHKQAEEYEAMQHESKNVQQAHSVNLLKVAKQEIVTNHSEQAQVQKAQSQSVTVVKTDAKKSQLRGNVRKAATGNHQVVTSFTPKPSAQAIVPTTPSQTAAAGSIQPSSVAGATWDATFEVELGGLAHGRASGKLSAFTIRVHPEWAPEAAKRFREMLQAGLLKDARFFRVVPKFMVQFGIPGAPSVAAAWKEKRIPDDPVVKSNTRGTLSFASAGPNTRTTQLFINYKDNKFLDKQGFAPFAEVVDSGMEVVDKIQAKYKEKPLQSKIQRFGNTYLIKRFPQLSFINHVDVQQVGSKQTPQKLVEQENSVKPGSDLTSESATDEDDGED